MKRQPGPYDRLRTVEIAAMWLFGEEYARSGTSAVDYYRELEPWKRDLADRLSQEIVAAYLRNTTPRRDRRERGR